MQPIHTEGLQPASLTLQEAWSMLAQTGWLSARSPEVRKLLRPFARLREFDAGEVLYRADDTPNGVFGLVEGALEITVPGMTGEEGLFHRAEPGFWIGDLALFAGQRRLVTIRAAGRCTAVHLSQEGLASVTTRYPGVVRDFYELSHENMRTALQLLANLAVQSADSRIALRLLMHDSALRSRGDWIRLSHDALSQLVAVSPKTVRRTLVQLQRLELIETGYGRIRVIDHDALARYCSRSLGD